VDISFSAGELPSGRRQLRATVTLVPVPYVMQAWECGRTLLRTGRWRLGRIVEKIEGRAVIASLLAFAQPTRLRRAGRLRVPPLALAGALPALPADWPLAVSEAPKKEARRFLPPPPTWGGPGWGDSQSLEIGIQKLQAMHLNSNATGFPPPGLPHKGEGEAKKKEPPAPRLARRSGPGGRLPRKGTSKWSDAGESPWPKKRERRQKNTPAIAGQGVRDTKLNAVCRWNGEIGVRSNRLY
jgi:hypothetical protein